MDPVIERSVVYRLQKLEELLMVVLRLREEGTAPGRGRLIDGANTVEVLHPHWLRLLEASDNLKIKS